MSVSLKEPPKALVHDQSKWRSIERQAFAVLFDNAANACYEATVSLSGRKLANWKHIPGASRP